eukprot:scaffold43476_cov50-Cyclotella_meneghiniana.AAC.3
MKVDALRHQIAQFDYTCNHVPVGPTPTRLPCTNQPLFLLYDDEAIIARSPSYKLLHHGPTAESLINCHDREDITELKPLSDVGHQRGCHIRDGDQLHMRIVPSLPRLYDDRCVNCLIKEFQVAEGGSNSVRNGQSYWLSGNRHPRDILESPRPTDAIVEHSLYYDKTEDE